MAVGEDDVRRVATLARISVADEDLARLARELDGILVHMEVLRVAAASHAASPESAGGTLRDDDGTPVPLRRPIASFAPHVRDGFFLVPRLETHEGASE